MVHSSSARRLRRFADLWQQRSKADFEAYVRYHLSDHRRCGRSSVPAERPSRIRSGNYSADAYVHLGIGLLPMRDGAAQSRCGSGVPGGAVMAATTSGLRQVNLIRAGC